MVKSKIAAPKLKEPVLADLVRIGLAQPDRESAAGAVYRLHEDLVLFLPLLTGFDVRLVPMNLADCPVKFCTGILKLPAAQAATGRASNLTIPAGGQADTSEDAAFGCLGELTERLSLCTLGESDSRVVSKQAELPEVEFAKVAGLSETQRWRVASRMAADGVDVGGEVPNWAPISERRVLLTQLGSTAQAQYPSLGILFRELWLPSGADYGFASTVGCAVWRDLEGARRRALLELVERDAVAQAWYNRMGITRLDRDCVKANLAENLNEFLDNKSRSWGLYSVDIELHAHVVMAISYDSGGRMAAFGSAAGWDFSSACNSAVEELLQSEYALGLMDKAYPASPDPDVGRSGVPRQLAYARQNSIVEDLLSDAVSSKGTSSYEVSYSYEDLLQSCLDRNIEIWEFDATRSDLKIPCVKLISKDLCSWEPRFGKRRLYQGVVDRGLRQTPATEDEFSQRPFPF